MRLLPLAVLLALAAPTRADDVDPEPPPGKWIFRSLKGHWKQVRYRYEGREVTWGAVAFRFDGSDRGEYEANYNPQGVTLKLDRKRRDVLILTFARNKTNPRRCFFKIFKGELYLIFDDGNDPNRRPDFSGAGKEQVLIFQRVTK